MSLGLHYTVCPVFFFHKPPMPLSNSCICTVSVTQVNWRVDIVLLMLETTSESRRLIYGFGGKIVCLLVYHLSVEEKKKIFIFAN